MATNLRRRRFPLGYGEGRFFLTIRLGALASGETAFSTMVFRKSRMSSVVLDLRAASVAEGDDGDLPLSFADEPETSATVVENFAALMPPKQRYEHKLRRSSAAGSSSVDDGGHDDQHEQQHVGGDVEGTSDEDVEVGSGVEDVQPTSTASSDDEAPSPGGYAEETKKAKKSKGGENRSAKKPKVLMLGQKMKHKGAAGGVPTEQQQMVESAAFGGMDSATEPVSGSDTDEDGQDDKQKAKNRRKKVFQSRKGKLAELQRQKDHAEGKKSQNVKDQHTSKQSEDHHITTTTKHPKKQAAARKGTTTHSNKPNIFQAGGLSSEEEVAFGNVMSFA